MLSVDREAMRTHAIGLFMVICVGGGVCMAATTPDASATKWLQDMRQAASKLSYQGNLIYLKDNRVDSFQVFHGLVNGVERERMLSTNTPLREVVRADNKVTCYLPDSKTIAVEEKSSKRSILVDFPDDVSELGKYYEFALGKTETVAQRSARLVTIKPKDDLRYERQLWIDVETKLPLKFQLLDGNNQSVEQIVYTTLTIEPELVSSIFDAKTKADETWNVKEHQTLSADSLKWTLDGVPDGFHLVDYSRLKRSNGTGTVDHILLTDGFASVSVYIDQLKDDYFAGHPRKIGAINSFTRKLDNYLITVMGEVPEKTVQSIANGIHQQ